MSKVADARAEALLDEAEGSRRACMPASRADREKMRRLRATGTVISPARGMYARLGTWQGLGWRDQALWLMRALSLKHPSWVFCEASAAIVHGLSVSVREGQRLHVATPPRRPAQSTSLVCRHRIPARHNNQRIDGVTVTSLERTAFDCLRRMRLPEGLALADSTLRAMGHVSPGSLIDRMCALHAGERGLKGALATL